MLLERQSKSGMTIRDFCENEAYSPANFYYWKRKFCTTGTSVAAGSRVRDITEDLLPVRLPVRQQSASSSNDEDVAKGNNEIMVELPGGIKIHFRGSSGTRAGIQLITQLYSNHVLSE